MRVPGKRTSRDLFRKQFTLLRLLSLTHSLTHSLARRHADDDSDTVTVAPCSRPTRSLTPSLPPSLPHSLPHEPHLPVALALAVPPAGLMPRGRDGAATTDAGQPGAPLPPRRRESPAHLSVPPRLPPPSLPLPLRHSLTHHLHLYPHGGT